MARNGTGTYALPESAFVFDTVVDEAAVNSNFSDIASEITNSVAKDGQSTMTGALKMGAQKITGMAVGTAQGDGVTLRQVQAEAMIWCGTAGGTADAITLTPSPAIAAYAAGQRFVWIAGASPNTGAMTVAVSGLTTKAAQNDGSALAAGDHAAGKMYIGVYDGTQFQISRFRINSETVGDVVGPGSATDNSLARFDGTTGKLLKDGAVIGTDVLANLSEDATPTLGGNLIPGGFYIGRTKGTDIASATPTVPTDGDYFDVTGTTGFAAMTVAANRHFFLQFDGALTMTHHATNLDLPGEADITTAAGDVAEFFSTGANTVQCVNYTRADGMAVGAPASAIPKAWVDYKGTTTNSIRASFNVSSVTDNGNGNYTINFSTGFSTANYCAFISGNIATGSNASHFYGPVSLVPAAGAFRAGVSDSAGTPSDAEYFYAAFFGDQ